MIIRIALLAIALFCLPAAGLAAGPDMQEGQWEMTVQMDMPGMPFKMPPMKHVVCMEKENPVPQPEEPGKECSMKKMETKGNTVKWEVVCKDKDGSMRSEGEVTYRGNAFDGIIRSTMKSADGEMPMTQKVSGKRLGPCK